MFGWRDAQTVRVGAEYRLGDREQFPVRLGYVFDGRVSNARYPTAFGTPPAPTHSLTAGTGHDFGTWQINLALAHRFGSVTIEADELADPAECRFCNQAGDYELTLDGIYVDVSADLSP